MNSSFSIYIARYKNKYRQYVREKEKEREREGGREGGREREFPNCPLKGPKSSDYHSSNAVICTQDLGF